jgi:lysophospholipase L1-like esterase
MWWQQRQQASALPAMDRGPVTRVLADEYVENLTEIARLAERHGGRGLVLAPTYRDRDEAPDESERISAHRARLRDAMKGAGIPFLEIQQLTEEGWPDNRWLFGEKIHPSASGHKLMAIALLGFMAENGMLTGLTIPPLEAVH